jgi:spermidine synthase
MLFSMGLGSRISRYFEKNLLSRYIQIEFSLSVLTGFSSLIAYTAASFTIYTGVIIYAHAILIGFLIGMEIPLVTRLNSMMEELRINISSVLEYDYYGSLLGGIFFAFVGLPYLGITYTPFILGAINFLVAVLLMYFLYSQIEVRFRKKLIFLLIVTSILLLSGVIFARPIILFGQQSKYKDKVIYSEQSRYQRIVMTQWKDHYWLFLNGNQQLSTLDEALYHEPLVHPVMSVSASKEHILVLGGGDGAAVREVLKYPEVEHITLVDLDPAMTDLAKTHPVMVEMNDSSLFDPRVEIINQDGYHFLERTDNIYDVMIVDLPDPKTVDLGRLYSLEFYEICRRRLTDSGLLITQAGSPYYAPEAFECIKLTLAEAGFNIVPMHNQILTLGEWGWVAGAKNRTSDEFLSELRQARYSGIDTQWINNDAVKMMTQFSRPFYLKNPDIKVNRLINPVLYKYYNEGKWDVY